MTSYLNDVLADDPLYLWLLDDRSGTAAAPMVNGYPEYGDAVGSYVGGPTLAVRSPIATNYAVQTTASGYVSLPLDVRSFPGTFTLELWWQYVSGPGIVFRDSGDGWRIDLSGTYPVFRTHGINHTITEVTSASLKTGARHHFVLYADGAAVKAYIDGSQVGHEVIGSSWTDSLSTAPVSPFLFGKDGDSTYSPGIYAAVAFYQVEVDSTHVAQHYADADIFQVPTVHVGVAPQPIQPEYHPLNTVAVKVTVPPLSPAPIVHTTRVSWGGGLQVATDSSVSAEPAVVMPPAGIPARASVVTAYAWDSVDLSGPQPVMVNKVRPEVPRVRSRVVVNGKDVSFFRDVETPEPDYQLQIPLLYGGARLEFPQIHAAFERPGHGDLSWLAKNAPVLIQRVDASGTVVATDFRGYVGDYDHQGGSFGVTVLGEAVGRAQSQYRPPPIFPQVRDIGTLAMTCVQHELRLPVGNQPTTGIEVMDSGGGWQLDYLTNLLTNTNRDGQAWTIMPNSQGVYSMSQKDTSTVHFTVYQDDANVVANLRRDFTQEPNRVFVQASSQSGYKIDFAIYPGFGFGPRPAFPGTLSPGDSGAGVTAAIWQLWTMGWLDGTDDGPFNVDWTTAADDPVTDAVTQLQLQSGLTSLFGGGSTAGVIDAATWDALFDPEPQDSSLRRSQVKPAAQKPYTQAFLRTASGQIIKPNPKYRRNVPWVDVPLDMGVVKSEAQAQRFASNELADDNAANWVGLLTINTGAVIAGEHNPGDPAITSADLMDVRSIKPGMNAWMPLWDGGTKLQVASVNKQAGTVTLAVDTRARDAMKVWAIIQRNQDSKRDPARSFFRANLSSKLTRDKMTGANKYFGKVNAITCPANQYTVFPVIAGQEGQVRKVHVQTDTAKTVFWLGVFGKHISAGQLAKFNSNPLDDLGVLRWQDNEKSLVDDYWRLAYWGEKDQPCGYYPKQLDTTASLPPPVTGEFLDDGGFPYYSYNHVTLWVAIYPLADTVIQPGRILTVQLNDQV